MSARLLQKLSLSLAACSLVSLKGETPETAPAWQARWISPADEATTSAPATNLWTCYRRSFSLSEKPSFAPTRIAADSKYWLWVNGRLAVFEGGLKRGPNPRDTYYDELDLAPWLQPGKNQIAVLTWYWGRDGFSHKSSGQPGFLFELRGEEAPAPVLAIPPSGPKPSGRGRRPGAR